MTVFDPLDDVKPPSKLLKSVSNCASSEALPALDDDADVVETVDDADVNDEVDEESDGGGGLSLNRLRSNGRPAPS